MRFDDFEILLGVSVVLFDFACFLGICGFPASLVFALIALVGWIWFG